MADERSSASLRIWRRGCRVDQAGSPQKVRSRIPHLLQQVRASLPLVSILRIVDNSSAEDPFRPVLTLSEGSLRLRQEPLPDWAAACLADTPAS